MKRRIVYGPKRCPVCGSRKVTSTEYGYRCERCGYTHSLRAMT